MEVIETPDTSGSETSGTIEKIRLVNFMCHSHYELNLCPRVNFIVGENGSGKSAILVALAICFGAKAHFTNRGKKVSDIIKQGENYAEVTVCLKNTGSLRMDPSKYGDTIAIERRITKEGASYRVYALKANEKQRIVGRKASDVSAILDHFNIPIDNPCILLMQDTSKTFLTSTRAEDKYNFFLKATQLEKIKSNYKLAEDHLKRAKRNKEEKDPQKNQMQTHVDALEHRIKRVLDFNNVKEKLDKEIDLLKRELAASKVQDITKEKSHLLENQQTVEDSITQATPEHIETQINSTLQKIESIKKILSDAKFKSNALNNKKEARMSAVSTSKGSLNEIRVELRDQQETVERTKARQKLFEDTIEEIRNTDEDDTRHKLEEKRFKLEQNQMELDETKKKEESESEQLKSLESELASKSSIYAKQSDDLNSLKNRLRNSKKEKSHAEYTKRDSVSMYHRFIPKLLEEMKKVKFKSTPIGPIGEYIRLTDKKWCHVVENCVSRQILASFVCSDESDVQTIKNIGKRINYSVTTFCYPKQNPQKYQVNKQSHAMVCDILKIDSPYVFNVLIDHVQIDRYCVAEDRVEAQRILDNSKMQSVYILDGSLLTKRGGIDGFFPYTRPTQPIYGGEDINETIKALERGINQLEIEISSKEDLNKSTDAERNVLRKQIGDLKTVYGNTQRDVRKLETKKMEIESIKIKERDDLAELEKNLNDATNELDLQISNLKNIKRRQDDAQKDLDSKQREYQNVCGEATTANAERERHENELSECKTQLDKLNEEKDEVEKTRDKLLVERQQIFQKLTTVEIELKHAEEELSGVGNYSDSPRPQDVIAKNLKESEAKKKRHEEDVTDLTVVDINLLNREFEKKRDQLERLKTQLNSIDELSEQLARELSQRQKRYKSLLNKTSTKTLDLFNQYLREIGATGKLKLEHKRHLLDVEVALTSLEKDSRDSKTLSGGERSFSTVCLLLALWNVVDCPFRAMDEFDVYMDSAVRKKAIETLMKVTKNLKNRQYIFVTPHNIDSVTQDDNVKVFLLKRPERGQTPT